MNTDSVFWLIILGSFSWPEIEQLEADAEEIESCRYWS